MTAEGTMEMTSWDEQTTVELDDGRKLTTTSVTQKLSGDVEGDGSATWLAAYQPDGTAEYVGYQQIVGRDGTLVLRMTGTFDGQVARSKWEVVEGMGTGAYEGASGTGASDAPSGGSPTYSLDLAGA